MSSLVVVGSINVDMIARVAAHPAPGETVLGRELTVLAGGKGANQAVAAAQLGGRVTMVGAVGDDSFAETALAGLRRAGVDLRGLSQVPGRTGMALVQVSDSGENSIVVVPGVNSTLDATAVAARRGLIASASTVLLQGEIPVAGIEAAARLAVGRVVLNLAPAVAISPEVICLGNPLVVNEHEGAQALKLLEVTAESGQQENNQRTLAAALLAAGVPAVVITLGAAGVLVGQGREIVKVPTPEVLAVDTTGAGDAFTGALGFRLAGGYDLLSAARFAVRVGAYAVTGRGAQAAYPGATDRLPE